MYQPYPFYGYPPPVMMPPPQQNNQISPEQFQKGIAFAHKLATREEREKQRKKDQEKKERRDAKQEARDATHRLLNCIYLYVLGILSYPFVGPLYNWAIKAAHTGVVQ